MKVAIDLRPLMGGNISGVEKYIVSMLHAIFDSDQKNEYILWYNVFKEVELTHFPQNYPNVTLKRTRWPNKLLNVCLSLLRWPKIDRLIGKGIDALWVPDPRPAPVSKKCMKIITFHDLSFEDFKDSFNRKTRLWHKILRPKKEASEADQLIAVSQFTKDRLIEIYNIDPEKVTVINEALPDLIDIKDERLKIDVRKKYDLKHPYFLFLSTLEPRKNLIGAISAFIDFKQKIQEPVELVIAGKSRPDIFTSKALNRSKYIRCIGFVDEKDKPELYKNALAFIYPSFYEGFGLPLLEAMEYGTPVITSNLSSMPEVVGEAAILVDPKKPDEIQLAMNQIYQDSDLKKDLIQRGRHRVSEFSWKKAAQEFLDLIHA